MLESIFMTSVTESALTLSGILLVTAVSIALGVIISTVYIRTNKANGYSSGFATTLIMLPLIICIIIMLVGNNIARAFSLAGAFSIIRFRSVPGEPRDISYVLFTLAIGLACGMGYLGYGALFTLILCCLMVILERTGFGKPQGKKMQLKIMVPEQLNYEDAFDEVLKKYADTWRLEHIKSKDFGALFELCYIINLREGANKKEFLDELRCRNGNLNIVLTMTVQDEKAFG